MNKSILFIFVLLLAVNFSLAGDLPGNARISLLSQEPDPVEPGSYVDLRFKIENYGTDPIPDLSVMLEEKYPISLAGEDAEKYLGTLWGGLYDDYGVVVKYRVKLTDDAIDGSARITLKYKSGERIWNEEDFTLNVRAIFDQVFVNSIKTNPEIISSGDTAKVVFELVNHGSTTMKDITITLDLSDDATPFVPYGEISQKRLTMLKPNEFGDLTFAIRADPNAASQLYKIPITLEYYDSLNNKFTKTDILGIEVGGTPQIFVGLEESEVYMPGATGDLVINIVNNGETDIKFLKVKVLDNGDYVIIEGDEQYIGNLDSDDFETVKLKLHLQSDCEKFKLPVELEYKDSLGNDYTEQRVIPVPYYTEEEAQKYGLTQKNNTTSTVIFIVVVVVLFFGYRMIKKKKNKA